MEHPLYTVVVFAALLCGFSCRAQSTLKYQVFEEESPGTFVADVLNTSVPQTLQKAFGAPALFQFQDPKQKAFKINRTTGVLRTNERVDRESLTVPEDTIDLEVLCTVKAIYAIILVQVKVLDINDNDPRFAQPVENISIAESAALNTAEFDITGAQDADIGNNSVRDYKIIARNDPHLFALRVKRPTPEIIKVALVVVKKLDRETNDSYSLTILAKDGGNPPRTGVKRLNITITDSNDNSPQFSQGLYIGQVNESAPVGTFVVRVTAADKDLGTNAEVRYSLAPRPQYDGLFKLDSITGELTTDAKLDYERDSEYQLEVIAKDQGPGSITSSAVVKVQLLDKNDNSPTITVRLFPAVVDSNGRVPEDVAVSGGVATVKVQDEDSGLNGQVSVTMEGQHSDFTLTKIQPGQYMLQVARALNLDRFAQYNLLFKAEDRGQPVKRANLSFTLQLADSNRNAPKFSKDVYRVNVADDLAPGSYVATPTATDDDYGKNARLSYFLDSVEMIGRDLSGLQDVGSWFGFETQTGQFRLMKTLWCTFTPGFLLTLSVRDGGRTPLSATTVVNVTVACAKNVQRFSVPENQPVGSHVGTVMLTPVAPSQRLLIHFLPQEQENFKIDNETGVITTNTIFDREVVDSYVVKGVISDGQRQMGITLFIKILDENDHAPEFVDLVNNQLVVISGAARIGERVFKVGATDKDSGKNAEVNYYIEDGNEDGTFVMDERTGELVVNGEFTRTSYELLVRVMDRADIPKDALIRIQIKVAAPPVTPSAAAGPSVTTGDREGSQGGFFSNTKVMIVVIVCSALVLLALVVVVVILVFRRRKRNREKKEVLQFVGCSETKRYSGHEISREEAITATRRMYSDMTENYIKNPAALQKLKNHSSTLDPLLNGGRRDSPRMLETLPKESPNVYYSAHPKGSPHSEDDLDSGRGGSTSESTPPSARSHAPRRSSARDRGEPSGYSSDPPTTRAQTHAPADGYVLLHEPRSRRPVVDVRDSPRGVNTVVTIPGITHSTTDL